jgi:hypothetical protein
LACRDGFCAAVRLAVSLGGDAAERTIRFHASTDAVELGFAGLAVAVVAFGAPVAFGALVGFGAAIAVAVRFGRGTAVEVVTVADAGDSATGGGITADATGSAARATSVTPRANDSTESSVTTGKYLRYPSIPTSPITGPRLRGALPYYPDRRRKQSPDG